MKTPLLTIVIPTKNRQHTLNDLIDYFLSFDLHKIEVIIEDNSDFINQKIINLENKHIVYNHTSNPRSMVENCEIAVSRANGCFVTMLGDDDGIDIDLTIDLITKKDYDFYLSPNCTYYWPGLKRRIYGARPYGFQWKYAVINSCEIDPKKELKRVLNVGGTDILNMPRLYQGVVKREFLEKIKSLTGYYLNAAMPDMSSSAALAIFCEKGYLHSKPFIINGASSNSGGGLGASGKHVGTLENAYGLTAEQVNQWPSEVPRFWTGGTVWSSSFMVTLKKLGRKDLLNDINIQYIYSYIIAYHFHQYYSILGLNNLKFINFIYATPLFLLRIKSLINNLYLYLKLGIGLGIKSDGMKNYLLKIKS